MQIRPLLWPFAALILTACASTPDAYDKPAAVIQTEMASAVRAAAPQAPEDDRKALYPPLKLDLPMAASRALEPRFDLAVNDAPARQVLLGIVAETRYSMLLPDDLQGRITVNLKNVTVPEALTALKQLYGYEYRIDGSRIFVEAQKLQTRVLKVNYLNAARRGSSDIRVTSGSISDSSSTTSSNGATTSGTNQTSLVTSKVSTTVQSDFWTELAQSLKMILGDGEGRNVVISPQSGVIVVRAMPAELTQIEAFLKASQLALERQVIIEAKIMEVTLSNDFQAGINWAAFNGRFSTGQLGSNTTLNTSGTITTPTVSGTVGSSISNASTSALFGMVLRTGNFAAALSLLEEQGKVHVLSSPRIATLNNQKAVLKVGSDDFFVTGIDTTTTSTSAGTTTTPKITLQPFFSGISLDVTPQINDERQVTLHVHPMISEVTTATQLVELGDSTYSLPTASSKISEMDSIVKAQDGQMIALGGLIRQRAVSTDAQVPWLGGIPLIGNLFKQKSQEMQKRELVILLKPTIVQNGEGWSEDMLQAEDRVKRLLNTDNARLFGGEGKAQ